MADNDLQGTGGSNEGGASSSDNERKENSVLFSLSNLAAVGSQDAPQEQQPGHAKGGAQGDASGLIDLNTLASLGAGSPGAASSDAPAASGASDATAVPALFNVGTRRSNKGLIVGIVFLLLVVVGLGVFLTYVLVFQEEEAPAEASAAAADEDPPPGEEDLGVEGAAVANKAKAEDEAGAEGEDGKEGKEGEEGAEGEDGETAEAECPEGEECAEGEGEDGEQTAAASDDKDDKSDRKKRRDDDDDDDKDNARASADDDDEKEDEDGVDSALSRIRSGKSKAKPITPSEVKSFLKSNSLKAKKCGSSGKLIVAFTLKNNGRMANVRAVGGDLKGKPEEDCILKVVKRWRIRKFSGKEPPVKYPIKL